MELYNSFHLYEHELLSINMEAKFERNWSIPHFDWASARVVDYLNATLRLQQSVSAFFKEGCRFVVQSNSLVVSGAAVKGRARISPL